MSSSGFTSLFKRYKKKKLKSGNEITDCNNANPNKTYHNINIIHGISNKDGKIGRPYTTVKDNCE